MKKKIRNLILSAALAVGLGVTGIAATAQARGVLRDACNNHDKNGEAVATSYDTRDNNRFTHTKYTTRIPCCSICGFMFAEDAVVEEEEEPHDLVFSSAANRWECTCCDYWE